MPTTAVWTSRLTTASEAARLPTVVGCSVTLPNRMKLYSALTDQFCRKAHSTPAPATQPVRSKLPVAEPARGPVSSALRGPLLPDHREMHDGLHGFFHVLAADPFEPGVKGVFAGKDVGAGQAHPRQPRAVGAAADRASPRFEPGAADRLDRILQ